MTKRVIQVTLGEPHPTPEIFCLAISHWGLYNHFFLSWSPLHDSWHPWNYLTQNEHFTCGSQPRLEPVRFCHHLHKSAELSGEWHAVLQSRYLEWGSLTQVNPLDWFPSNSSAPKPFRTLMTIAQLLHSEFCARNAQWRSCWSWQSVQFWMKLKIMRWESNVVMEKGYLPWNT